MSSTESKQLVSVWTWVGLVLTVFGLIVTGSGIYYVWAPVPPTRLAELNPCLWWGAIMLTAGLLFLIVPIVVARRPSAAPR